MRTMPLIKVFDYSVDLGLLCVNDLNVAMTAI